MRSAPPVRYSLVRSDALSVEMTAPKAKSAGSVPSPNRRAISIPGRRPPAPAEPMKTV